MKRISEFFNSNFSLIATIMLIILFLRTCNNDTRVLTKRIDTLKEKIDSLTEVTVTKRELQIEGLKTEKRMIQSTDRKMMDVSRQSEIDKEIEALSK